MEMFFKTLYNHDTNRESERSGLDTGTDTKTVQDQKEECDINVIVARFGLGGTMNPNQEPLTYADFTEIVDFKTAADRLAQANQRFNAMPANVRSEFQNDPQRFMEFCTELGEDGSLKNLAKMREMGLAIPAAVMVKPEPQPVIIINPEDKK